MKIFDGYSRFEWTFLNKRPPEWCALSFPTTLIQLSLREIDALTAEQEDRKSELAPLRARLTDAFARRPHFVRLNTRSPKDVTFPDLPITPSADEALRWIRESKRTRPDLIALKKQGLDAFIALREPIDIKEAYEFRAFVRNGDLIGISQYYKMPFPEMERHALDQTAFFSDVSEYCRTQIAPYAGQTSYVIDLYCPGFKPELLIEVNPYEGADGGCVEIDEIEQRGGLFLA